MVTLAPKVSLPVKATSTMRSAALKVECTEVYSETAG
jgi:hypothetical protein